MHATHVMVSLPHRRAVVAGIVRDEQGNTPLMFLAAQGQTSAAEVASEHELPSPSLTLIEGVCLGVCAGAHCARCIRDGHQ